jgi:nitroreductase
LLHAAQNLMLAACGRGLGTCCVGFARPWLNLREVKSELAFPNNTSRSPARYEVDFAGPAQPETWEFEEPAATEAREDPGLPPRTAESDAR